MAERRMLAKSVIVFGEFAELSASAQVLYLHLNMNADDDGIVGNPRPVMRMTRTTDKHLKILLDAGLLLRFDTGPCVITHWLVHNQLRKDRYKPTVYREEFQQLFVENNKPYRFLKPGETGCQNAAPPATQVSLGKEKLGEVKKGKKNTDDKVVSPEIDASSSYSDFEKMVLEIYTKNCTGLAPCLYLDADIRRKIGDLENKGWTESLLDEAFRIAGECAFLQGENERGWKGTLDWLCEDENLRKVCAGKYKTYKKPEKVPYGCGELGQAELEAIQKLLAQD